MFGRRQKVLKLRWLKRLKTVPKISNLDQNFIFGVYLLISDFLVESFKAKTNSKKDHSFYKTFSLKKSSLILRSSTSQHYKKSSSNTTKNVTHLINFPAYIYATPVLYAQELHSRSTWKANVCISCKYFCSGDVRSFYLEWC